MIDNNSPMYYLHKYGIVFYKESNVVMSSEELSNRENTIDGFDSEGFFQLERIYLNKDVKEVIWNGLGRFSFYSFEVDPMNPIFQEKDGVLYTKIGYDRHGDTRMKRMIELVACPTNVQTHNIMPGTIRIANCAFKGSKIKSLVLPDTLEEIGTNAFYYANNLRSLEIPLSIREIEPQRCSFINRIKYNGKTFTNWTQLFDYLLRNGFVVKNYCYIKK